MADTPKLDKKKLIPAGEAFNILSFGVKAIQETTAGVKKSMQARIKQQKQIKKDQKIAAARLLNKQKKEDVEKKLESAPKTAGKAASVASSIKASAGGMFNRIMTAVTSVIVGWMMDKLPKIFEWIEKAVKVIQPIVKAVTAVFTGIFNALDTIWSAADGFIARFREGDIPKDVDKVGNEFKALEGDLADAKDQIDSDIEGTKDAINKFAKEKGSKDVEDPNKTPIAAADKHLHEEGGMRPAGLDTSEHAKALHDADEASIKADVEAQKKANEAGIIDQRPPQSNAKTATKKPKLDYNDQTKVVMAEVDKIDHKKFIPQGSTDTTDAKETGVKQETAKITPAKPVESKEAVGDGTTKSKKVTPSGLGMDMYSRKIILNPDAARGWTKVLAAAAKEGLDLTNAVTSSYRSPEQQKELIANEDGVNVIQPAPVDQSPHVQGWAVDIATNTPEWKWMKEHGPKFGWRWQGNDDPVHFDYMQGAPDNTHWMQPGRNDWMQGNLKTGEKVASLQSTNNKTTIPLPINKIISNSPTLTPQSSNMPSGESGGGSNVLRIMKTINSAYT